MEQMNSRNRLQLIREAVPGTYNPAGERAMMVSLKGDIQPDEAWASFRPEGFNEDAWHALERSHRVWSGVVRWDFRQAPILLQMLCGAPLTDETAGGVRTRTFTLPESGARNLDGSTYTLEYGALDDCERCTYGVLLSIALPAERTGDSVEGAITILCQKPVAEGVAMTGAVTQAEIQRLLVEAGDGAGYTVNGSAPFALGDANAAIQTAVRATGGNWADVVVGGVSAAPVAGGAIDLAAEDGAVRNGDMVIQTSADYEELVLSEAMEITQATVVFTRGDFFRYTFTLYGSNDGFATETALGSGTDQRDLAIVMAGDGNAYSSYRVRAVQEGGGDVSVNGDLTLTSLTFTGEGEATPATADLTFTFPVDLGNVPLGVATGTDAEMQTTQQGSVGSLIVPARVPMLNKNFSVRRAADFADLNAATPLNKSMMVNFDLGALINPIWFFDENEETYQSHVDGEEPSKTLGIRVSKSSSDLAALNAAKAAQPSTPAAYQVRAVHADDSDYSFKGEFFAAITGAAQLGAGSNVRYVEFPLATVIHGGGFAARFIVTQPA